MSDTRAALPDWPAMMPLEMAASYLSVGAELFKGLAARKGVRPVDLGARRTLWRKRDLDALVDELPLLDSHRTGGASSGEAPAPTTVDELDPGELALQRVRHGMRRRSP